MHMADMKNLEESKQVRLQEEMVMREKALRDTRIRGIHEMEDFRRSSGIAS